MKHFRSIRGMMLCLAGFSAVTLFDSASRSFAQPVPLGDEFIVSTYTTFSFIGGSRVSSDADGNFVIVWGIQWSGGEQAVGRSVRGQLYDSAGDPLGTEFEASASSAALPKAPDVAMQDDGTFMIVWKEGEPLIAARGFDQDGMPSGTQFRVDSTVFTYANGYQHGYEDIKGTPAIAAGGDGNFMIAWPGGYTLYQYHLHDAREIRGQVVDGEGAFVGDEFRVGGSLYYEALGTDVTANDLGQFVVVWNEIASYDYPEPCCETREPNFAIRARRFDATGASTSDQISVGQPGVPIGPSAAIGADGDFVVAWTARDEEDGFDVSAQRYDDSAAAVGDSLAVSSPESSQADLLPPGFSGSDIAVGPTGHFAVVWDVGASEPDGFGDGDGPGIMARIYAADGTPQGPEMVVNSYTTGEQRAPAVVFTSDDELLISWTSDFRGGSSEVIAARRFSRAPGCGDGSADGVNTATDALVALGAAVGTASCSLCVCDTDASGVISATDALLILNDAVGNPVGLSCVAC